MRLQTPTERVVHLVAAANEGIHPELLLTELDRCLPLLRAKHGTLGPDLTPLAADLVLCLTSPAIRQRIIEASE